ncbi:Crp/Fnr family transcriptional regulator [Chryseobacterium sp. 2R14A]|uniref:Crp/Fnr family transcriptional regulator n=1 Tax=Chryseobacterium sp. 2R14A TaxID=3380353 RepID=UPI003CF694EE
MVIDVKLLLLYESEELTIAADEIVFNEGSQSDHYYQIKSGSVKLVNSFSGAEFTHAYSYKGDSLGEEFLLSNHPFSYTAIARKNTVVFRLSRNKFLQIIHKYPDAQFNLLQIMGARMRYKNIMMYAIATLAPRQKILAFLKLYKEFKYYPGSLPYEIPFTRQEIANMIGIRVETVIRNIKELEKNGELKIIKRKIFI